MLTKAKIVPRPSNQFGARHGPLDVAAVDAMDPAGVEAEEIEDHVRDVRHSQQEDIVGHQQQNEIEDEVGPHRAGW
jgi:hypothetical protein